MAELNLDCTKMRKRKKERGKKRKKKNKREKKKKKGRKRNRGKEKKKESKKVRKEKRREKKKENMTRCYVCTVPIPKVVISCPSLLSARRTSSLISLDATIDSVANWADGSRREN